MDPKSPTLDPKLKEAYDRIMGATLPSAPQSPPAMQSPVQPQKPPMTIPTTQSPLPTQQQTATAQDSPSTAHIAPPLTSHVSSGFVAPQEEKKPAVSGTLLIIAGVVFFIVYTLFCLKLFGIPIPFLG